MRGNIVLTYRSIKSYYRRWAFCLGLSPAYVFSQQTGQRSVENRFNVVSEFFSLAEILDRGFDAWWAENRTKVQTDIVAAKAPPIMPFSAPISLSDAELHRQFQSHLDRCREITGQTEYLDNLTITDNRLDHQERHLIDRMLSAATVRFLSRSAQFSSGFSSRNAYQRLKQHSIADLVDPGNYWGQIEAEDINRKTVYINNQVSLFSAVSRNACCGIFYSSDLDPRTSSPELLWANGVRESFLSFRESKEFLNLDHLLKLLKAVAPGTFVNGTQDLVERLPNPDLVPYPDERATYVVFPDQSDDAGARTGPHWDAISTHLDALFARSISDRRKAAMAIAYYILEQTHESSEVTSIDPKLTELISNVLPYLYQEKNWRGSLDLLWGSRPLLFVESYNARFGSTILLRFHN